MTFAPASVRTCEFNDVQPLDLFAMDILEGRQLILCGEGENQKLFLLLGPAKFTAFDLDRSVLSFGRAYEIRPSLHPANWDLETRRIAPGALCIQGGDRLILAQPFERFYRHGIKGLNLDTGRWQRVQTSSAVLIHCWELFVELSPGRWRKEPLFSYEVPAPIA